MTFRILQVFRQCQLSIFTHHFIPSTNAYHIVSTQLLLVSKLLILNWALSVCCLSPVFPAYALSAHLLFTYILCPWLLLAHLALVSLLFFMPSACVQIVYFSFKSPKRDVLIG